MRISDWSSDVCSSDLAAGAADHVAQVEVDDRPGAPAGGGVGKTAVDGADRLVVDDGERVDGDAGGDRGVADGGRAPAVARMVAGDVDDLARGGEEIGRAHV